MPLEVILEFYHYIYVSFGITINFIFATRQTELKYFKREDSLKPFWNVHWIQERTAGIWGALVTLRIRVMRPLET